MFRHLPGLNNSSSASSSNSGADDINARIQWIKVCADESIDGKSHEIVLIPLSVVEIC